MTILALAMRRDGVTAVQLASELRCSVRTVSRWCNGRAVPQQCYVDTLAARFRLPAETLLAPITLPTTEPKCHDYDQPQR